MKCPRCSSTTKRVLVSVARATSKVVSQQCKKCDYFSFERESSQKVLEELRAMN